MILLDTNVLVYAYDVQSAHKQGLARAFLAAMTEREGVCLSAQVLSEFFVVATRKLVPALSVLEAQRQLERFCQAWTILPVTAETVLMASGCVAQHQLSLWDAQLWAVAKQNGASMIVSEDLQAGHDLAGVRFINPFAPDFSLAMLDL